MLLRPPTAQVRSATRWPGSRWRGCWFPKLFAYAGIAGLAPQHAVVASVAGLLADACIGSSRYAIVTPTSSSAAILAAAVATLSASGHILLPIFTRLTCA